MATIFAPGLLLGTFTGLFLLIIAVVALVHTTILIAVEADQTGLLASSVGADLALAVAALAFSAANALNTWYTVLLWFCRCLGLCSLGFCRCSSRGHIVS